MRLSILLLVWIVFSPSARANEFAIEIRSERSFGYFVGDLVKTVVDIRGPSNAELIRGSLPDPVPLTVSLDLRDVSVEEFKQGDQRLWRIRLAYQNLYAALDVRNIEVPAFTVSYQLMGEQSQVTVPAWRFGVAPLREIAPEPKERGEDYLRPDPGPAFVDQEESLRLTALFAALTVLLTIAVAWDHGWPPFHRRAAREFSVLVRRLEALARRDQSMEGLRKAACELHRAFNAVGGKSLLRSDLDEFFRHRAEFASVQPTTERFFEASERLFFDPEQASSAFTMAELVGFAKALAAQERSR
ncbi:hypothetical protein [Methylocystis bryophila]|uniref:MxaA protein n=1 Tax=Methylocystis bryophila TaxID=655015 RepID=A0A1W6MSB1_9HYPH|nr:hypothetical protein [Methylocystis bryophila]ARN80500.1 hypothetical protein B1812_04805 [Methylocystis bryophila]BDV40532.1 hypothetical protein DSM21852_37850 [Methylocystis bryophila]